MPTCPECRRRYPDPAATHCDADGVPLVPDTSFGPVDRELTAGEMVGEYRIERRIGKGTFGVVYAAVHPVIGKAAAVKVLSERSADPHTVSRFVAEARAVNQIRHRNIVDIFSFGALADGRQYYVMELLEGEPLDQYFAKRGPIPPEEAFPVLERIARALDAAHGAGIVHRDLKPANVFLAVDTDGVRFPKLLDFGIAKLTREDEHYTGYRTHTGAMLGTPYYMSPEQCRGESVDYRTDVYSFGVMVHETLAGRLPFEGDSLLKIMTKHTAAPPPRMTEHNPTLSHELDAPVLWMLEKDPARRPPSAGEAFRALSEAGRAAGYAVPSMASPSDRAVPHSSLRPVVPDTVRARTPAQTASTLVPQTVSNRPPRRLVAFTTAITTSTVLVLVVAAVVVRLRDVPRPSASASPFEQQPPASGVIVGSAVLPPETAPLAADRIRLEVRSMPPVVEAFLDGQSVGKAPGPFLLPRGDEPVAVRFEAPGYVPKVIELVPSKDRAVSVSLTATQGSVPPHARPKRAVDDLEF